METRDYVILAASAMIAASIAYASTNEARFAIVGTDYGAWVHRCGSWAADVPITFTFAGG